MNPEDYVASNGVPGPVWDEKFFTAGRLAKPQHIQFWEEFVLQSHPEKERLLECLKGMRPSFRRFSGKFAGKYYDCNLPPERIFQNRWPEGLTSSGLSPEKWALQKVLEDVKTGALLHWGKVGAVIPPKVVLPLSVELGKPRLIHDARFTNLWCDSRIFSLDKVASVAETFDKKSFLGKYDHHSGYHALLFEESAREYFGFAIDGEYYVPAGGIFGWNELPEIYHNLHAALVHWAAREFQIPTLVYLDDTLSGSLRGTNGQKGAASAAWAMEMLVWINFLAGYTLAVKKSVLRPCQEICFLGIIVNTVLGNFSVPQKKKNDFLNLINEALDQNYISAGSLAKVAGKGISFMLAVGEAAKVFTREMFDELRLFDLGRKSQKKTNIPLSAGLIRVFKVWTSFLNTFDGAPWLNTMHSILRIQTDASGRRWGGVLKHGDSTVLELGEEFSMEEMPLHIEAKEALAILKVIEGIAEARGWKELEGRRLDVWIDNQPLAFALSNGASRMKSAHRVIERLFWLKLEHHFVIIAFWWDTKQNVEADIITRTLSPADWRLDKEVFSITRKEGSKMIFFSRFFSPGNSGVNLLAQNLSPGSFYCFPPPNMVSVVVRHILSFPGIRLSLIAQDQPAPWMGIVAGAIRGFMPITKGSVVTHDGKPVEVKFGCWLLCS
jgi:hypothetical protein